MSEWTNKDLDAIGDAYEIQLTTKRGDRSPRRPLPVWVVRDGDDLYVRSWRGRDAAWFRSVQRLPEGSIRVDGRELPVTLTVVDDSPRGRLDEVYRAKYRSSGGEYVDHMVSEQAREAVVRLLPREEEV
jgi:hypothetical protein